MHWHDPGSTRQLFGTARNGMECNIAGPYKGLPTCRFPCRYVSDRFLLLDTSINVCGFQNGRNPWNGAQLQAETKKPSKPCLFHEMASKWASGADSLIHHANFLSRVSLCEDLGAQGPRTWGVLRKTFTEMFGSSNFPNVRSSGSETLTERLGLKRWYGGLNTLKNQPRGGPF